VSPRREGRFWAKVEKTDSCWLWRAASDTKGYGRFYDGHSIAAAHRVSYELLVGPIPDGLCIDHLCRVPACVNPSHLEPVTNRENVLRGTGFAARLARKTHCKHGHEFTPENTGSHRGHGRRCRTCAREESRANRARTRKAA
jgi:hypothetical protein